MSKKPYKLHDLLTFKARQAGFRARSVYKLQELDQKFHLIRKNQKVLDIGSFPGSWLQYVSDKIQPQGQVTGLDIQAIKPISANVQTLIADVSDLGHVGSLLAPYAPFDLVLSDISPNTSGVKDSDHIKSIQLNKNILSISQKFLQAGGDLIMKLFPGREFEPFVRDVTKYFKDVRQIKVMASRVSSNEIYLVCLNKR